MKIEKNIPFPITKSTYPFSEMEVGDSILITERHATARSAAVQYKKKNKGVDYIARTLEGGNVRIWRIELL